MGRGRGPNDEGEAGRRRLRRLRRIERVLLGLKRFFA